jgi:Tfp pilus assembly protein PilF
MPEPEKDNPLLVESPKPPPRRRWHRWVVALVAMALLVIAGGLIGRQAWAAHHVRLAEQSLDQCDFTDALEHLEQSLRLGWDSAATRLQAARAARRAGNYARAQEHLAARDKEGGRTGTSLERLLLRAQQGDLAETEQPLENLIRNAHPDALLAIEALARGYMEVMRMGSALSALNDLVKRDPNQPLAYFLRGGLYERLHRTSEALPDYRRAVELAPRQDDFRLALAIALLQAGHTAEAGPHFDELLHHRPGDPRVLLSVARYHRACARPQHALEFLERMLRDQPENVEAWAECGRAYRDQRNSAEAVRCLRKAYELEPHSYAVGFDLYTELYARGDSEVARAIEQEVEHHRQQQRQVEQLFAKLEQNRNSASLRHELGMAYLRMQQEEEAVRWLHSALQSEPTYRPSHQALAEYYQRQGSAQVAAFHRQRAGATKP